MVYATIAAWCWIQSISQWLGGSGLFGIDLILALGFSIAVVAGAVQLPSWYRKERLRRKQIKADTMLAAARAGNCGHCGYDLTGLTSEKCPECGVWIGRHRATP